VPEQSFQHAATTPTPIPSVWSALDEPQTWEAVPGVDRVVNPIFDASGRLRGFSFETIVGGRKYLGQAAPAGREDQRLIAWDIRTSEINGRVTVGLSPVDIGTRIFVDLRIEGIGVLGSLFFPVIAAAIGNGFTGTVEDFVRGFESPPG
jgi:hypothetical protein